MQRYGNDVNLVIKALEQKYSSDHPRARVQAYRYNPASIRVRIIDPDFKGMNKSERFEAVNPIIEGLPEEVQSDVMLLVLLTPQECKESMANQEFENPTRVEDLTQ